MESFKLQNVYEELKNNQIYPSKRRVEINDKIAKLVFNLSETAYSLMIEKNKSFTVTEKKNHKKHGNIKSSFKLQNEGNSSNIVPLDETDRSILGVCMSNLLDGNHYVTPAIIYRGLTGKVNKKSNFRPSKNQLAEIISRIDKMMFTSFDPDTKEAYEQLKYDNGDEIKIKKSAVLPCCRVEAKINGQTVDAIYFDRESPLLTIAYLKKQIVTYDAELLDVPNQNNTMTIITAKNYTMRRIQEIILHPQLQKILTFEDIFKKCRLDNASRKAKADVRDAIVKFFETLKDKGVIDSFELVKKGNSFYSIHFTYSKDCKKINQPFFEKENLAQDSNSSKTDSKDNSTNSNTDTEIKADSNFSATPESLTNNFAIATEGIPSVQPPRNGVLTGSRN